MSEKPAGEHQSRQEVVEYIAKKEKALSEHVAKAHNGKPNTTCHKCLTLRQAIRSNGYVLREIDAGTWKF